jgi:hypothetical protein
MFNYKPASPRVPLSGKYMNVEAPLKQLAYIAQDPSFSSREREKATNAFNQLVSNSWGQNSILI